MNFKLACACIVALVAAAALILLFYASSRASVTGAVSSNICPQGSAVILAEGPGKWREEIRAYERLGHYCFFGYDGVTPCCARTRECCLPSGNGASSSSSGAKKSLYRSEPTAQVSY